MRGHKKQATTDTADQRVRPTCPCKTGSRKCHMRVRLLCSYSSVSGAAHTTWGWQDEEARLAQAHQPSWCLPLRFLCNVPCSYSRTQKHIFVQPEPCVTLHHAQQQWHRHYSTTRLKNYPPCSERSSCYCSYTHMQTSIRHPRSKSTSQCLPCPWSTPLCR